MSSNAELVKRWFRGVWCQPRDSALVDELLSDEVRIYGINPSGPLTKHDFKRVRQHLLSRFPDIRIAVTSTMECGDLVAFHAQVSGTHVDSSRRVRFAGTAIVKVRAGKFVESHETWDFATMLVQCGAVPQAVVTQELTGV